MILSFTNKPVVLINLKFYSVESLLKKAAKKQFIYLLIFPHFILNTYNIIIQQKVYILNHK